MMRWQTRLGLGAILAGSIFLPGCSSLPTQSNQTGPATRAYVISGDFTSILGYSTAPADNGSLMGTLALPSSYWGYIVATDSEGQIYVSGVAKGIACRILIYPANSTGAAVPSRMIDLTSSACPAAIAVDPTGRLYVSSQALNGVPPTVDIYSATASGTPTPIRTLTLAGIGAFADFVADISGNIYAAGTSGVDGAWSVQIYSSTSTGNAMPTRTITSTAAVGIIGVAVDAVGNIFVDAQLSNTQGAVETFTPEADGPTTPTNTIYLPTQSAMNASGGPVRVDKSGNLFISQRLISAVDPLANESYVIYGFDPTATGSAAPTVQITPTNAFFNNENFALN